MSSQKALQELTSLFNSDIFNLKNELAVCPKSEKYAIESKISNTRNELIPLENFAKSVCSTCQNCIVTISLEYGEYSLMCMIKRQNLRHDLERYEDDGMIKVKTIFPLPIDSCSHYIKINQNQ